MKRTIFISGNTYYSNYYLFEAAMNKIISQLPDNVTPVFLSRGYRGVEKMASRYARTNYIEVKEEKPDWANSNAGVLKAREICKKSDMVVLFWDFDENNDIEGIIKHCELTKKRLHIEVIQSFIQV